MNHHSDNISTPTNSNNSSLRRDSIVHSNGIGGVSWGTLNIGSWLKDEVIFHATLKQSRKNSIIKTTNQSLNINNKAITNKIIKKKRDSVSYHNHNTYLSNLEKQYCKDYSCCGLSLLSLHDLLKHYEETHINNNTPTNNNLSHNFFDNNYSMKNNNNDNKINSNIKSFDPSPITKLSIINNNTLNHHNLIINNNNSTNNNANNNLIDAVSTNDVFLQLNNNNNNGIKSNGNSIDFMTFSNNHNHNTTTTTGIATHTTTSTTTTGVPNSSNTSNIINHITARPNNNNQNNSDLESDEDDEDQDNNNISTSFQNKIIINNNATTANTNKLLPNNYIDDPARRLYVMDHEESKPFKCPVIGCDKNYKNQNGLKYHKLHGHQNQKLIENSDGTFNVLDPNSNEPFPDGLGSEKDKPYRCEVCGKRYKNLNGLKYHRAHSTH